MQKASTAKFSVVIGAALAVLVPEGRAIDIQFDYSYDTNNFFIGNLQRQNVLNAAAQIFESRLTDTLTAITPSGSNTWTATFDNPATGATQMVSNLTIAQGVLVVYAGARDLAGDTLGEGGPGGFSAGGSAAFVQNVRLRGQVGAGTTPPTDFGPWGGAITFDTLTSWYFDQDVTTMENIGAMSDFYSVALHELGHLLGFGIAPSWDTFRVANTFTGPASMSLNAGLPVLLDTDGSHWAPGTTGDVSSPGFIDNQEAAMDPTLLEGTRKYFTDLDFAGLDDLGWQVVPEPGVMSLFAGGVALLSGRRKRHSGRG